MPELMEFEKGRSGLADTVAVLPPCGSLEFGNSLKVTERNRSISSVAVKGVIVGLVSSLVVGVAVVIPEPLSILLIGSVLFTSTVMVKRRMASTRS